MGPEPMVMATRSTGAPWRRSMDPVELLPEEQKGCKRDSRGTHDVIFVDKMVLKEVKRRCKNLAMRWIDHRKAYMTSFLTHGF